MAPHLGWTILAVEECVVPPDPALVSVEDHLPAIGFAQQLEDLRGGLAPGESLDLTEGASRPSFGASASGNRDQQ
jgi:hypothetical protein